jgi:hypothetical protein
VEAYDLTTQGGSTDFARLIAACESFGPYCLIGGLAVNCYVEPVYTLDADLVVIAASLPELTAHLEAQGFKTEVHKHSVNALAPGSELRIQSPPTNGTRPSRPDRRMPTSWESV